MKLPNWLRKPPLDVRIAELKAEISRLKASEARKRAEDSMLAELLIKIYSHPET